MYCGFGLNLISSLTEVIILFSIENMLNSWLKENPLLFNIWAYKYTGLNQYTGLNYIFKLGLTYGHEVKLSQFDSLMKSFNGKKENLLSYFSEVI